MIVDTARLTLMACGPDELDAFAAHRPHLARRLDVTFPADFPVFPEGIDWWRQRMRGHPELLGWGIWFVIRKSDRVVIGDGGFKGSPDAAGEVETGYALVEQARRSGYGKEFVRGLVRWAFFHPEVNAVRAETLVDGAASIALLKGLGMTQVGAYVDPDEGAIVQWRVDRAEFTRSTPSET